ncbi:hypothetical protein PIB30_051958 [Stylosanthes scabra]|uniref:Uncharacterized protein n=1 Tax=Stylosanthes scabra TaxID=79078 RepID=A0ABU6YJ68_9FABA|nr:hypothetical protein [Stylosanthes scabra]
MAETGPEPEPEAAILVGPEPEPEPEPEPQVRQFGPEPEPQPKPEAAILVGPEPQEVIDGFVAACEEVEETEAAIKAYEEAELRYQQINQSELEKDNEAEAEIRKIIEVVVTDARELYDCGTFVMKWMEVLDPTKLDAHSKYPIKYWSTEDLQGFRNEIIWQIILSKQNLDIQKAI